MSTLILLALLLPYLAVGTAYSRARYVNRLSAIGERPTFEVLDRGTHPRICDYNPRYGREWCDCNLRVDFEWAKRSLIKWDREVKGPTAMASYARLLVWPLILHHGLMVPPQDRETRRERRMRHELENARHIAEITAIAKGNQDVIGQALASLNPLEIEEDR